MMVESPRIKSAASKKGNILLFSIAYSALLLLMAVILLKVVYNSYAAEKFLCEREQAFWLARGGVEIGKNKLAQNHFWYTDLPHVPANDAEWIKNAAFGEINELGQGKLKLVREKETNRLYSVGMRGRGRVILNMDGKEI